MGDAERVWRSEDLKSGRAIDYVPGLEVPKPAVPKPVVSKPVVLKPAVPKPVVSKPVVLKPAVPEPATVPQTAVPQPAVPQASAPSHSRGRSPPPQYGRLPFTTPRRRPSRRRLLSPSLSPPSPTLPDYPSFRYRGRGRRRPLLGGDDMFDLGGDDMFLHSGDDISLPRYRSSYRRFRRAEDRAAQVGSVNKTVAESSAIGNQRLEPTGVDGGCSGTGSATHTANSTPASALASKGKAAGHTVPPGSGKQPHLRLVIPDPGPGSIVGPSTLAGGTKTAGAIWPAQTLTAGKETMPPTSAATTKAAATKAAAPQQQQQQKQGAQPSSSRPRENQRQGTASRTAVAAPKPTTATTPSTRNKPGLTSPRATPSQTPPANKTPQTAALQQKKPSAPAAPSARSSLTSQAMEIVSSQEKGPGATGMVSLQPSEPSAVRQEAKDDGSQQKTAGIAAVGESSASQRSAESEVRRA